MRSTRIAICSLSVAALLACSKKSPPPSPSITPVPVAPADSASMSEMPTLSLPPPTAASVAPADAAPPENLVEAVLQLPHELTLGEGKLVPLPKFKPASPELQKAHEAKFKAAYSALAKDGWKELNRFHLGFVPVTFVTFQRLGTIGFRTTSNEPTITNFHTYFDDGDDVLAISEVDGPMDDFGKNNGIPELWRTPRGYLLDLHGDGSLSWIVRRTGTDDPRNNGAPEMAVCVGTRWQPAENGSLGEVSPTPLPTFPTRALDVDADGHNDFPTAIFAHVFADWALTKTPTYDDVCNRETHPVLELDVVGAETSGDGSAESVSKYYEHRLAAARAKAKAIRLWAGLPPMAFGEEQPKETPGPKEVPRRKTVMGGDDLRLNNECALDVAQTAAELFVYARISGNVAGTAVVDADTLMGGFHLRFDACSGFTRKEGATPDPADHWPAVREALMDWSPGTVGQ